MLVLVRSIQLKALLAAAGCAPRGAGAPPRLDGDLVTHASNESHGVDAPALPHPTASAPPALRAGFASGGRGLSCGRSAASLRLPGCARHRRLARPDASNPAVPTVKESALQRVPLRGFFLELL